MCRAKAGRLAWYKPELRPWVSFRRWVEEQALPSGAGTLKLWALDGTGSEVFLSEFPLPGSPREPDRQAQLDHREALLDHREARLASIEAKLDRLVEEEEDDDDEHGMPPWLSPIADAVVQRAMQWLGIPQAPNTGSRHDDDSEA